MSYICSVTNLIKKFLLIKGEFLLKRLVSINFSRLFYKDLYFFIYIHIYSWFICVYIYLHQAEDNLFVSPCEHIFCLYVSRHIIHFHLPALFNSVEIYFFLLRLKNFLNVKENNYMRLDSDIHDNSRKQNSRKFFRILKCFLLCRTD